MKLLITCLIQIFITSAIAQTKISGKIVDTKGKSIPGANILIKDSYDGASSSVTGDFSFSTSETGNAVLMVTFIGYESYSQNIELKGEEIKLKITLKEIANELSTVTISAGAIEASDKGKAVILRPLDIVTTAGAQGDITGAIQTLPGVQSMSETEGLFVRGGSASETKTIIDGMVVQNPYYSSVPDVAQRGRFSPFLFKNTVFSTGGYSAQYGQALSSALILESQDIPDKVNNTTIALSSVGAGLGHSHRWKKTSAGIDVNYSNLQPYYSLAKTNLKFDRMPQTGGGSFIFRHKTSQTGLFKIYATQSFSDMAILLPDTSGINKFYRFGLTNSNSYLNASYKEQLNTRWALYAGTSFSRNADNRKFEQYDQSSSDIMRQGKVMITRALSSNNAIRFGTEAQFITYNRGVFQNFIGAYIPVLDTINEKYYGSFVEADWYLTKKLVARIGARYEYSKLLNKSNIAPRVSLGLKAGKDGQISLAYGDFYQTPGISFISYSPQYLSYEKATHYILNYQIVQEDRTFRIEAYHKKYSDLIALSSAGINNGGTGYARGLDIFWRDKKTFHYVDYWISYSYLDTKRKYLNFPKEFQPPFAADHTLNVVVKRFFTKIQTNVGLTYTFASGRPYYLSAGNTLAWGGKTSSYNNLSANASYLTNIKGHFTVLVLSVSNVLGFDNIFSYRQTKGGLEPVRPLSKSFAFIGCFISIGKDAIDE